MIIAVIEHGTAPVDKPCRIGASHQLGIDETSFLATNRSHSTLHATGLVDLDRHVLIDMVAQQPLTWADGLKGR